MTTMLVVDDNPRVRRAPRMCLELHKDWKVIGEADTGQAAIDFVRENKPDIVLLDYAMPGMNGIEAAQLIATVDHECTMLLFTMHASDHLSRLAESVGIRAVVSKGAGGIKETISATRNLPPQSRRAS